MSRNDRDIMKKKLTVEILICLILTFLSTGCSNSQVSQNTQVFKSKGNVISTTSADSNANSEMSSLKRQIEMLEFALSPQKENDAIDSWARGVKTRNGALQFALLSPELQMKMRLEFTSNNWVTGASSPWVRDYSIVNIGISGNATKYEIRFNLTSSTGKAGEDLVKVTVQHDNSTWFITKVTSETNMFNLNMN